MKTFKLWVHKSDFSEEEIVICQEDLPQCSVGDVLEIHHPGDEFSRLLLKIKSIGHPLKNGVISVQENVAKQFQLRAHRDVQVRKMAPQDVEVNLVELVLKDQYVGRSDMYRMKQSLIGSCAYVGKKLNYSGMRISVREMWRKNSKVMCGCISEQTRIVYRSASASMLFLVQLSSEMWQFNKNGELFLETAIDGFFADLISHWKRQQCNHQMTIVLFSRSLYTAQEYDLLSPKQQQLLCQTCDGNYYQDFYRVVVDSESRSDWGGLLGSLRQAFLQHCRTMNQQHEELGCGINSPASRGNLLEALNMAVNAYSRHYVDCNFERNGQQVIVVTSGVGVFEVERDLMTLTKLRIVELGIGADLVCLAEQPLHHVPLFIFSSGPGVNPYKIPHWINHSYYKPKKAASDVQSRFQPRIHMPKQFSPIGFQKSCSHNGIEINAMTSSSGPPTNLLVTRCERVSSASTSGTPMPDMSLSVQRLHFDIAQLDFDGYDGNVFAYHTRNRSKAKGPMATKQRSRSTDDLMKVSPEEDQRSRTSTSHPLVGSPPMAVPGTRRGRSASRDTPTSYRSPVSSRHASVTHRTAALPTSLRISSTSMPKARSFQQSGLGSNQSAMHLSSSASSKSMSRPHSLELLINPFSNQPKPKMTANNARWRQAFPVDDSGKPMQEHHTVVRETMCGVPEEGEPDVVFFAGAEEPEFDETDRQRLQERFSHAGHAAVAARNASSAGSGDELVTLDSSMSTMQEESLMRQPSSQNKSNSLLSSYHSSKRLLQPAENAVPSEYTEKQDFLKEVRLDWKSLAEPACLPLGTDFEPENLSTDFMESQYTLYYDDEKWDTQMERAAADVAGHPDLSERQIFFQLVLQRLGQGFQLIDSKFKGEVQTLKLETGQTMPMRSEYWLVLGQHIHRLRLQSASSGIEITRYKPRYQYAASPINYKYSLSCQSSCCSTMHNVQFTHPTLDEYNWNYLDQYVCGDRSFCDLLESLKYWRCCFLLLPLVTATKSGHSQSGSTEEGPTVAQSSSKVSVSEALVDSAFISGTDYEATRPSAKACLRNFLRFVDLLNRIRRSSKSKAQVRYVVQARGPDDGSTSTAGGQVSSVSSTASIAAGAISLDVSSPLLEIWSAMQGAHGVDTMDSVVDLPNNTFLALDGIDWLLSHVVGLSNRHQASMLAQSLMDSNYIQHASGERSLAFLDGVHFYSFVSAEEREKRTGESSPTSSSLFPASGSSDVSPLEHFQNTWFEVALPESALSRRASSFMHCSASPHVSSFVTSQEIDVEKNLEKGTSPGWMKRNVNYFDPGSLEHNDASLDRATSNTLKTMVTQSHASGRSDMPEWCAVRYPGSYEPNCAFHFEVQWMVATSSLVNDMVQAWARKASSCGFQMLPAPMRPFDKSAHPLQCGTFVSMDIEYILTAEERDLITMATLLQVQSLLLDRLSFLAVPHLGLTSTADAKLKADANLQGIPYVHLSGVGFAQPIVAELSTELGRCTSISTLLLSSSPTESIDGDLPAVELDSLPKPWHFSKVGFLFMPNVMLGGRWKSHTPETDKTVCEQLQANCSDKSLLRQLLDQVEITMS
eukprot:scpid10260/ scgid29477/ DEP domain-containing protein 5